MESVKRHTITNTQKGSELVHGDGDGNQGQQCILHDTARYSRKDGKDIRSSEAEKKGGI